MAIRKMAFVQIKATADNYKETLIRTHECADFHAELAAEIIDLENGDSVLEDDGFYRNAMNDIRHLSGGAGCGIAILDKITKFTDEQVKTFISELTEQFTVVNEVNEATKLNEDDMHALEKLKAIGLEKIHDCTYLRFGFGRLTKEAYKKLFLHDSDMFSVSELHKDKDTHWICYATSHTYYKEVRQILDSLFFEELALPPVDVDNIVCRYNEMINEVYTYCNYRYELLRLYKFVGLIDGLYIITGFIPRDRLDYLKQIYHDLNVEVVEIDNEQFDLTAPTMLKNNWFVRPFEMFVKMYSLPAYKDFDPTSFVCITYCILFGIMFADLGQGMLLALGGALILKWKPKMTIAAIINRVGIFSMIFGFLFGSFFGNEHLLNPLHQSLFNVKDKLFEVMHNDSTMPLLIGAVAIGAFLILSSMLLNMYLKFKHKEWGELLFGQNGVAGFVFYSFILVAIVELFLFKNNLLVPPYTIIFIGLPVLSFILEKQLCLLIEGHGFKPKVGWGSYILESFFEAFDILLSFITNSMSYLRVGGFVLSHAGMMLVVMTLVEMTGNAGILVMIFGNLFVMCLEGLIVGIQALRLEYYEMFSRYYTGGGREFRPITSEI